MAHERPYYRAYPSNFLGGSMVLTAEEKGVYRTLLDVMYDTWEPIPWEGLSEREFRKQKQHLARLCGCSSRRFGEVLVSLLAYKKVRINSEKMITNTRFEKELYATAPSREQVAPKEVEKKVIEKTPVPYNVLAKNKDLTHDSNARAIPESRVHSPDESRPGDQVDEKADACESMIQQVAKAMGVSLQSSIWRHGWVDQLNRMIVEDDLDFARDVLAVIKDSASRKWWNPEAIRSLRAFRADFIRAKDSRLLTERLRGRDTDRKQGGDPTIIDSSTDDAWKNRIKTFLMVGAWVRSEVGPSPVEPGCKAPRDLLLKARKRWDTNGQHPTTMFVGNQMLEWKPGVELLFLEPKPFIID